jgi:hypothetical protein
LPQRATQRAFSHSLPRPGAVDLDEIGAHLPCRLPSALATPWPGPFWRDRTPPLAPQTCAAGGGLHVSPLPGSDGDLSARSGPRATPCEKTIMTRYHGLRPGPSRDWCTSPVPVAFSPRNPLTGTFLAGSDPLPRATDVRCGRGPSRLAVTRFGWGPFCEVGTPSHPVPNLNPASLPHSLDGWDLRRARASFVPFALHPSTTPRGPGPFSEIRPPPSRHVRALQAEALTSRCRTLPGRGPYGGGLGPRATPSCDKRNKRTIVYYLATAAHPTSHRWRGRWDLDERARNECRCPSSPVTPRAPGPFGEIGPPRATECAAGRGLHPSSTRRGGDLGGVWEPSHDARQTGLVWWLCMPRYPGSRVGP